MVGRRPTGVVGIETGVLYSRLSGVVGRRMTNVVSRRLKDVAGRRYGGRRTATKAPREKSEYVRHSCWISDCCEIITLHNM